MFRHEQVAYWCVKAVEKKSANVAVREIKKIPGLIERPYVGTPSDKLMPTFDQACQFLFKQPKAEYALVEVLAIKNEIIQAGLQISFEKKMVFSAVKKPFADLKKLLEDYFDYLEKIPPSKLYNGVLEKHEVFNKKGIFGGNSVKISIPEVCFYTSNKNVRAYLTKKSEKDSEILNFKVGSNKFWKKEIRYG